MLGLAIKLAKVWGGLANVCDEDGKVGLDLVNEEDH
jgi:hypothetical protein